ncbi:N-acetylglucosaminyl deacetylase, LmbE family [Anaerobranca californiensis DSM 14826]|uniref:N-acetylglucosaminyl deacetylase, LmbE family n=1 Tax=Anaerobranca californiensis DSM 14826 TaxID=1120989 RepID=A0A1M6MJL8_9FIRM|nr:PIG-L family deacetylase [Anaerobranca californiensis]SHJ83672.1 N-acetylglucosaminyl deacetylase, LmbE family [Anaerobranca californiensis DSM 14826]
MGKNKNILISLGLGTSLSIAGLIALNKVKQGINPVEPELALKASEIMFEKKGKVLAFSPHPDDLEFFAGGTIKLLVNKGFDVTVVDITDGEKGVNLPNLGSIRQNEQKKAQKVIGYQNLKFLHYPDMKVNYKRLLRDIRNIWYEVDPQIVFTFDNNFPLKFLTHKDHLAVGKAVCQLATEMDSNAKVYLYASRKNNLLVDISQVIDDKIKAVLCHKSQLRFSTLIYDQLVRKMASYASMGTNIHYGESFRTLHNFDSFPKST